MRTIIKKLGIKRVSKQVQQAARRQLVVFLSALLFTLLPLIPTIYFLAILLSKWIGNTVELMEALVFIVTFLITYLTFGIISGAFWIFLISFYLTVQEYKDLYNAPEPYVPFLTTLFNAIAATVLNWKIRREQKSHTKN